LSERISFVVPKQMRKALRQLQELTGEDQSSLLRKLVNKGLAEAKMDIAIDQYVKEKSSLAQSSSIAGVSLWRFLDELRSRNIALKYSMADAQSEIDRILGKKKKRNRSESPSVSLRSIGKKTKQKLRGIDSMEIVQHMRKEDREEL
jgi:predicted HTH domain antitoxin